MANALNDIMSGLSNQLGKKMVKPGSRMPPRSGVVISPDKQYGTGTMGKQPIRTTTPPQAQQAALDAAKTPRAAKARGEMGYNPSGTQGAKGTEAKFMNPAMYSKRGITKRMGGM